MEGEGRQAAIPHVSALDGARGVAVAGVLLFHGGHLTGGYLGVDFFFTLSGFLITSLLLAESGRAGSVGLGGFWARRARRLLPALAVLMVGVAVYSVTVAKPVELTQIRGDAFATLALREEVSRLGAHGAKVVVTTAAYARYSNRPHSDRATDCDNRLRRKVAAETGAQLVDLFGYICPDGKCRAKQDGVTLRPDGQHYEGRGGEIVAKWLVDQVDAN